MSLGSVSLIRDIVTDSFVGIANSHLYKDEIDGFGSNGELHGSASGYDWQYKLPNERYSGIGIPCAFFNGHSDFYGQEVVSVMIPNTPDAAEHYLLQLSPSEKHVTYKCTYIDGNGTSTSQITSHG
jgi:hypothetical protein